MKKPIKLTSMMLKSIINEEMTRKLNEVEQVPQNVLTVGDLIATLSTVDPSSPVFIENHGEFRAVNRGDVSTVNDQGITTDDGEFVDYSGPAVLVSVWG